MGKGQETRERLMDIAEVSVLTKGFGATSIDEIIAAADITKSGFFYHFNDKNQLALALLRRYVEREDQLLDDLFGRARELHDDPLHAFLIGLKLFAEMMADLSKAHPGCLVATCCYNERLFDSDVRELNRQSVLSWRQRFLTELEKIAEIYPPKDNVDLEDLADMVSGVVEGGIVMSKALEQPQVLARQILLFRSYLKLLFLPAYN
ncbi:MAG: TetR/AcrR family transcriptional regulator [Hyphomicrobiales bacterium]|nr:TetR/AcrR family transcriptional regulator [Hyphomicrobiales bacterium]MCP5000882.1 TetR/AcrR family transcriptional regulator [Hyphomicrobiales bacterium]